MVSPHLCTAGRRGWVGGRGSKGGGVLPTLMQFAVAAVIDSDASVDANDLGDEADVSDKMPKELPHCAMTEAKLFTKCNPKGITCCFSQSYENSIRLFKK